MNGREIYWPSGRTLGGSSAINGLIYIRGQRDDYDHWAALGNPGWGYADVLPYFRKLEHNVRGASEWHGADGPLWASDIGAKHELVEALIAAGGRARHPAQRRLQRRHAGRRRLLPADDAQRLPLLDGGRLPAPGAGAREPDASRPRRRRRGSCSTAAARRGVAYRQRGRDVTATARREVILAAGALQSPQLLQLSGIGPPDAAAARSASRSSTRSPGVGENLQDHLQARVIFRCTKPITTNDTLKSWWRKMAMGVRLRRSRAPGRWPSASTRAACSRAPIPRSTRPDVQFHLATLSSDMAGSPVHTFSGFTMSVCQLQPESRGHVRIRSRPTRSRAPAMQPNYLSTPRRPRDDRRRHPARAAARRHARARALRRRRVPARRRGGRPTTTCSSSRGTRAPRSSIRPAPARWARRATRSPSSTPSCACTASTACASSTAASCPRSSPATPTRRSS